MTGPDPAWGQTSFFPPEPAPDPLLCWLWLAGTLGVGSSRNGSVLDAFGGAQEAWEQRGSEAFRRAAGAPAALRAVQPDNTPEHYRAFVRRCEARRIRILTYDDPDYPLALTRIPDMPLVLYCTGDPVWLNEPAAVGMVGSRKPTEYGLRAAEDIGCGLARAGAIVVSGLADGLDSAGHRPLCRSTAPPSGCWACPSTRPTRQRTGNCGGRSRPTAASSASTRPKAWPSAGWAFAAQPAHRGALHGAGGGGSAGKSGTMSTVAHAERYGKPVFAVPGSIYSPNSAGTNGLLREGRAKAVCKAEDLFSTLRLDAAPAQAGAAPGPPRLR